MKNLSVKIFSALAVLSLVTACGKDSGSGSSHETSTPGSQAQETALPDGSNIDGFYQAKFMTLNPQVNGTIPGSANFFRKDDKLFAYIRLFAGGVKTWHMQFVYEGGRCPTIADDTNMDGFIDIQEAEAVTGKILIPMDSDITTQSSGKRFFPLADISGYYSYERLTSFRRFLSDLQEPDSDPTDDISKIAPGEGLRFEGKVFMALGVAETIQLPDTVATKERRRPFQTLPIVCGVYQKVSSIPGETYSATDIPGPVAAVEPGQDRPAEVQIPEPTTGGSRSGSTTGTNEAEDGNGPTSDGEGNRSTGGTTGGSTGSETTTGSESTTGHGRTTGSSTETTPSGGTTTGGTTDSETTTGSSPRPEPVPAPVPTSTTTSSTTGDSSPTSSSSSSTSSSTSTTTSGDTTGGTFGF
jgi:hypothetical protein